MNPEREGSGKRATFLSGVMAILLISVVLAWSMLICGGAAVYFVAVIGGLALLGFVHYILWGRFLNQSVAGEREEEEIRRRLEEDSTDNDPLGHQKRF